MREELANFDQYLHRRLGQSSTPIHYLSDLRIFFRSNGSKAPEDVTAADIDNFVDRQIAAGRKPSTINRRLSTIQTFFEFLAGENPGRTWPNPVINRRHRLKMGSHLPRDVSDNDVAEIFAVISDERDRAMFGLMLGAGLRVGEVATLRLGDVEEPPSTDKLAKLHVRGKGNKERVVWLAESLWNTLQAWLRVRSGVESGLLFLNWRGRPITVNGIQWCLAQYTKAAGVTLSCHRLRHTFGRRMAENGLPIDSLARLLGHNHLQTTQRYIDGADPTVRADFTEAMEHLETNLIRDRKVSSSHRRPNTSPQPRSAPEAGLRKLRQRLHVLPPWLASAVDADLSWRWPTWRGQTAHRLGLNFISLVIRISKWLEIQRQIEGWESFHRADLQAWLESRYQDGVSDVTIRNELARFRSLLRFLETRGYPIDPGLFRVHPPRLSAKPLPRYLTEADYRWLETNVLQATQEDTYSACFDRAWFLTLAHTGVRLSELLDLRLDDLDLEKGMATVRGGKPGRDRVVFLTPQLISALGRYLDRRPDLPDDDHLFVLHNRSPSDRTIQKRLAIYSEQSGVPVSPHRLRHTIATRLINQGMPIHSLRKLLGHQRLDTTQLYAQIYDATLYGQFKEAMERLEAIEVETRLISESVEVGLVEPG